MDEGERESEDWHRLAHWDNGTLDSMSHIFGIGDLDDLCILDVFGLRSLTEDQLQQNDYNKSGGLRSK